VKYEHVDDEYFAKRGLKRYARVWSLWAMGVGAVISGDFFGWSYGLAHGGFGGLLIATLLATAMYAGLSLSIAEMSPALPHAGGAYSFARSAMGPWAGYVTGLAENMEYILTPAVIVIGIGGYVGAIFGTAPEWQPLWWLVAYALFVGLNIAGVEITFRFTVLVTVVALAILAAFFAIAATRADFARWAFDVPVAAGGSKWLPHGPRGILSALPFAIWFYLGIEQLPLAAEEADDPRRDMPRGLTSSLATLVVCSLATLVLSVAVAPGAQALSKTDAPLYASFEALLGAGAKSRGVSLLAVAGLVASFHAIIFAYGRQIYSLSRAGYFPRALSYTHGTRKTPHVALVVGAVLGYAVAFGIHRLGPDNPVGAILLNMAVFGAVLSYSFQMLSYVLLRVRLPNLERPYKSPLGMVGALFALVLALITLVALFFIREYRLAVLGAAVWYALGLGYFALWGRHRLVLAPEEAAALEAERQRGQ
jgi:ethanolamine permease